MSRPLLITDCDEVLLHMVRHFGAWLDEAHDIDFNPVGGAFGDALTRRGSGGIVPTHEVWPLLDGFFRTEMSRQTLVPGAAAALERIGAVADIVILTNLQDWCHAGRAAQLDAFGIAHRVVCNQGGKGPAVARLLDEIGPSAAAFVDDLAVHHQSVAADAPGVWRLHMVAEPSIAATIPPAPDAHVRIDDWDAAADWLLGRLALPISA
ncbi:HAD family hydrolase [Sphingomonas nostoxanthinifaciens]|uniref:HAD family hydrolase n=1 Tax=Sphingomonas nostoxanthinifaciens TaxID=2872652 RepID=UPI001CC1D700|nr:HAD family hydrolase [Sphingomonas nostoxanthinifaciens]UAK23543.1 HAD family hydrolase [Sphingomonas nostoxanthinifaciens]